MQRMAALRAVAIAASIAWVIYGWADHIYPVFCLHAILLPLNTIRLCQALRAAAPAKPEAEPARSS